uniref:Protein kinase domain-containing protein n=1 Tax=Meloidogyne hapla TaxID=6305 RepID=A0A1I8BQG9_MELHA
MQGRVKAHQIPHVWVTKRCKQPNKRKCAVCLNSLGFLVQYEKCQSCKLSVHIECKKNSRVRDNCGLTQKHLKELVTQMVISKTQDNWAPEIGNSHSMSDIYANDETTAIVVSEEIQVQRTEKFDRRSWNMFTLRAWKDDSIPSGEIEVLSPIGRGRFGEVFAAYYYEPAVIKFFDMYHVDEQKRLEVFKQDTACFQNVRHENLIFFRGFYTIDRSKLGIVMEYIRGHTLFNILHDPDVDRRPQDFNDIIEYAKQICQNHFDKLFVRNYSFVVPLYWLRYIAPELLRVLNDRLDPITFTEASDVFSFGTIWYELLTNTFPFDSMPSDFVIWQIGSGMKAPLTDLKMCHEAKVFLMYCWSFNPLDRKLFSELLQLLKTMPRITLRRSPSVPICKSFESIF